MFAFALHSVFLAAAVSQQYSSRRLTVSATPRHCAASVTKLPLIWQFLSSRIRRSPTGTIGITYALTRISCLRNNYGRKRHNAVTPFATNYNRETLLADVIINERILFPKFGAYIVYHAFFKKSKKIIGKFSVQIWQKPFPSGKIPPEGQKERAAPFRAARRCMTDIPFQRERISLRCRSPLPSTLPASGNCPFA